MNDPPLNDDKSPEPRREARVSIATSARVRREGFHSYEASILDVSPSGCKMEFVDRPAFRERVWVKFDGLEFEHPIHPAVFELLLRRLSARG